MRCMVALRLCEMTTMRVRGVRLDGRIRSFFGHGFVSTKIQHGFVKVCIQTYYAKQLCKIVYIFLLAFVCWDIRWSSRILLILEFFTFCWKTQVAVCRTAGMDKWWHSNAEDARQKSIKDSQHAGVEFKYIYEVECSLSFVYCSLLVSHLSQDARWMARGRPAGWSTGA
jgi:hypothetical protein